MSIAQSAICRTWQPAPVILFFPRSGRLGHRGTEIFYRYKWPLATVQGEQISHHLSSHRNRLNWNIPDGAAGDPPVYPTSTWGGGSGVTVIYGVAAPVKPPRMGKVRIY